MEKELSLILTIINIWWKDIDTGSQIDLMDFQVRLNEVLEKCGAEDLDIIYHPIHGQWVIRGIDER
jgi:hypothetical protein